MSELSEKDCLLIVDVQRDFCTGGALAVDGGEEVVPVINDWIRCAVESRSLIVASRDWHPVDHLSFSGYGGSWPPHCVRDTEGAEFHPDLELPQSAMIVSKATSPARDAYSAFDGTGLVETFRQRAVGRVIVAGLALDYCVKATALDAVAAGFEVHLLDGATRSVDVQPGDGQRALQELAEAGVKIEEVIP